MGDRANVKVLDRSDDKVHEVYLYTHYDGQDLPLMVRDALERGIDRWDDVQYLTRVIFCEMIQDDVMGSTGYGITAREYDGGRTVIVDPDKSEITLKGGKVYSFNEFAKMNKEQILKDW